MILSSWRTANYDKEENCWRFCLNNVNNKVNSLCNDYIYFSFKLVTTNYKRKLYTHLYVYKSDRVFVWVWVKVQIILLIVHYFINIKKIRNITLKCIFISLYNNSKCILNYMHNYKLPIKYRVSSSSIRYSKTVFSQYRSCWNVNRLGSIVQNLAHI